MQQWKPLLLLIISLLIITCKADDNELKDFQNGNVDFSRRFIYESTKNNPGVSLILSPFSVLFLLAQLALYATGDSLHQLLTLLNVKDKTEIRDVIPGYLDILNSQQNVSFSLAERVYGNEQYEFSECFMLDTKNTFKAEAQNLDFGNSNKAASTINKWVANQTHDLIKNLVSPDSLSANTVLVLVNAIYFKGDWVRQFDPKNTKKEDFYVDKDKTIKVDMMKQKSSFKYKEVNNPAAQVIELPYKNSNFTFLVWLPKSRYGIKNLIKGLVEMTPDAFNDTVNSLRHETVQLSLPKFESSTTTDLKKILKSDNVTAIFNPQNSGLSGILKYPQSIYVSSATQKAVIQVNEKGAKAAAANVIIVGRSASASIPRPVIEFNANHPFVYYIAFEGNPIFCGLYYGA